MIEDLMKLKKQIDTMIETYKDLHPDDYELMDNGEYVVIDDIWQMYNPINVRGETTNPMGEEHEKQRALKRIREGYYESAFREKQRQKAAESSEGSPSLCVYGDS